MLRAVLDANDLTSAFIQPKGPSGRILTRFVGEAAFELVLSVPILDELRRILEYPRIRKRLRTPDDEIQARVASLGVLADVVDPRIRLQVVAEDPDDDKYLEAALEGRAGFLVSGDRHLLDIKEHQSVQILTPRAFLTLLEDEARRNPPGGTSRESPRK
jgi:hypothetical protein